MHETACLRSLFGFFTPLLLLGRDVLIRQQRLSVPDRGITDNPLVRLDERWRLPRVGGTNSDPIGFSTYNNIVYLHIISCSTDSNE